LPEYRAVRWLTRKFPVFGCSSRVLIVTITLNGEPFQLDSPMSVAALLAKLDIDPRRVAIEHNLTIIKRQKYPDVVVGEGDRLEIVNFVGGG
jgi:thiamine biosynthesis protein ThiS